MSSVLSFVVSIFIFSPAFRPLKGLLLLFVVFGLLLPIVDILVEACFLPYVFLKVIGDEKNNKTDNC